MSRSSAPGSDDLTTNRHVLGVSLFKQAQEIVSSILVRLSAGRSAAWSNMSNAGVERHDGSTRFGSCRPPAYVHVDVYERITCAMHINGRMLFHASTAGNPLGYPCM